MIKLGIIFGLAAALAQSASYIFSRAYMKKHKSTLQLLVFSHIIIGFISTLLFICIMPSDIPPFTEFILPVVSCTLFYIAGQWAFFKALRRTEASRISPLLGLKILFIAGIFALFTGQNFSAVQWLAVFLGMISAVVLNWTGERIPWQSFLWLIAACIGFSLSDLSIKFSIDRLGGSPILLRSICVAALCYALCGAMGIFMLLKMKPTGEKFKASIPFSVAWFAGALFLFACFGFIGPVFGNIVQSSRGIFSILIGVAVAHCGFLEIEKQTGMRIFIQRIIAAVLMTASIALFYLGNAR